MVGSYTGITAVGRDAHHFFDKGIRIAALDREVPGNYIQAQRRVDPDALFSHEPEEEREQSSVQRRLKSVKLFS